MWNDVRNVVIIGSGPAGLTAAVYASRGDLNPLVIEGIEAGGQLMLTTEVENYPGFVDGIMGPELMERFRKQAARFGTEYLTDNVTAVDLSQRPYVVKTGGDEYRTRSLIIATGASARMLDVPGERKLLGHGVSCCATCDGFFFKERELIVVGGGDSAMEEAIFLTKFASKVTVVHRREELRASKIMQDRARANEKIDFVWNSAVTEVVGNGKVEGVRLKNVETGGENELPIGGVFVAIGHIPNTSLFEGQLDLTEGYIVLPGETTETSVPGVFAAGDVVDFRYRQAITAAGMGCMAAIDAERYLDAGNMGRTLFDDANTCRPCGGPCSCGGRNTGGSDRRVARACDEGRDDLPRRALGLVLGNQLPERLARPPLETHRRALATDRRSRGERHLRRAGHAGTCHSRRHRREGRVDLLLGVARRHPGDRWPVLVLCTFKGICTRNPAGSRRRNRRRAWLRG